MEQYFLGKIKNIFLTDSIRMGLNLYSSDMCL